MRVDEATSEFATLFRRFLREVVDAVPEQESPLVARLRAHLGADPLQAPLTSMPVGTFEHPDVQVALDAYIASGGRTSEVVGRATGYPGMGFAEALVHGRGPLAAPTYVERPVDVDEQLACLRAGIVLVSDPATPPYALAMWAEDHGPMASLSLTVLSPDWDVSRAVLADVRRLMAERSVYRGKALSLAPIDSPFAHGDVAATFLPRPDVPRAAVVLPDGVLERIERRTVGFDAVADRLAAQGLPRKRGLLLYGPPGTGKTLSVQHVIGRMPGRTVVVLTGQALGAIRPAAALAGRLQPSMLVLEDVDLVAHDRSFDPSGNPVLFELGSWRRSVVRRPAARDVDRAVPMVSGPGAPCGRASPRAGAPAARSSRAPRTVRHAPRRIDGDAGDTVLDETAPPPTARRRWLASPRHGRRRRSAPPGAPAGVHGSDEREAG